MSDSEEQNKDILPPIIESNNKNSEENKNQEKNDNENNLNLKNESNNNMNMIENKKEDNKMIFQTIPKKQKYLSIQKKEIDQNFFNHFNPPSITKNKYKLSKLQIAIKNFNNMKDEMKKLFTKNPPTTESVLIKDITSMLSILDSLNLILDVIIEQQKLPKIIKKPLIKSPSMHLKIPKFTQFNLLNFNYRDNIYPKGSIDIASMQENARNKLIIAYKKQYDNLYKRLLQIKDDEYIDKLRKDVSDLSLQNTKLQKENRVFQTNQHISERILNVKYNKETVINELDKLINDHHRYEKEIKDLENKSSKNDDLIKENQEIINQKNDELQELTQIAQEQYNIDDYNKIKNEEKKQNDEKMQYINYTKKIETLKHIIEVNKKRYDYEIKRNEYIITNLNKEKKMLEEEYKTKEEENSKFRNQNNNNNEGFFISQINNNNSPNSNISSIPYEQNEHSQNNSSPNLQTNQSYSKKQEILDNLTKKQKEEEANNKSIELQNTNSSIVMKNIPLKPNFSFGYKLNENIKEKDNKNNNEIVEDIQLDEDNDKSKKKNKKHKKNKKNKNNNKNKDEENEKDLVEINKNEDEEEEEIEKRPEEGNMDDNEEDNKDEIDKISVNNINNEEEIEKNDEEKNLNNNEEEVDVEMEEVEEGEGEGEENNEEEEVEEEQEDNNNNNENNISISNLPKVSKKKELPSLKK